jgi:hypothetical protein
LSGDWKQDGTYFNCGKKGHIAKECPMPDKGKQNYFISSTETVNKREINEDFCGLCEREEMETENRPRLQEEKLREKQTENRPFLQEEKIRESYLEDLPDS